eukprot:4162169-Prymnesium_polylepis.2
MKKASATHVLPGVGCSGFHHRSHWWCTGQPGRPGRKRSVPSRCTVSCFTPIASTPPASQKVLLAMKMVEPASAREVTIRACV